MLDSSPNLHPLNLVQHPLIHGNGETYSLGVGPYARVDPHDVPGYIHEGAARISRVDGRVRLDERRLLVVAAYFGRSPEEAAYDSDSDCVVEPDGVADRDAPAAGFESPGVDLQLHARELVLRLNSEHREVAQVVLALEGGGVAAAGGQGDGAGGGREHVGVRQDVVVAYQEARTGRSRGGKGGERVEADHGGAHQRDGVGDEGSRVGAVLLLLGSLGLGETLGLGLRLELRSVRQRELRRKRHQEQQEGDYCRVPR
mmetsp:Transcript_17796/g.33132  ORF Transcript_17796/g.33132 Transcript_17796/m.33132 type:complete len:257 (-) Transcript_17796:630-1400(-)